MKKKQKVQDFVQELLTDVRWSQIFAMVCLMILSSLFVSSATNRGDGPFTDELKRQWIWFGVGWVLYIMVSLVDYHWFCRKSWLLYAAIILVLVYVLIFGLKINGARSWIQLTGGFRIQPSEFAKLGILLTLCYYLSKVDGHLNEWRHLGVCIALVMIPVGLIHKQPDLGTALVIYAVFFMILFIAGAPIRYFGVLAVIGLIGAAVVGYETYRYAQFQRAIVQKTVPKTATFNSILPLRKHQFDRIIGLVAPSELDRLREGWNRTQSLIAIGSGGLKGKGWNKGDVTHGGYLPRPVAHSDFIFSVFAEETGFIGGTLLIGLYATLLLGGLKIALKARDYLGMLLASGITFLLFFHTFVNMGMTLGILPIVGLPLPLMSYGGSFVLVTMIALGLLQSVWLHRKPY
jgi:rod shape determining protein RodA